MSAKQFLWIFVPFLLLTFCISIPVTKKNISDKHKIAARTFSHIDSLLEQDNGDFWGYNLNGPILLVDPETRELVANRNNVSGSFQKSGNLFTGKVPSEVNIANTAIDWEGMRWTMVLFPLPEAQYSSNHLLIHELFHRIQPKIGFDGLNEVSNQHLDNLNGRLLLRLELNALSKAIKVETEDEKKYHIHNALRFRNHRQASSEISKAENSLELNEGLAEYTGLMLSDRNSKETETHLLSNINRFYENDTFVRSFAYQTVPVYGYLLTKKRKNWHSEINKNTNLTKYFEDAFSLDTTSIPSMEAIISQNEYDYEIILSEEKKREKERKVLVDNYKSLFLESPTLKLRFENMKIAFDPRNIMPLEKNGTVYPTLRVTDNWGILDVDSAALINANWSYVLVSVPLDINSNTVTGDGWNLVLEEGWTIEKKNKNYELKKEGE